MTSQLIPDMPEKDYFGLPRASNSTIGKMKRSAAHCKAYMDAPHEPTASMNLGSLVHTLVLEPDEFEPRYYVAQEDDPIAPRKAITVEAIEAIMASEFEAKFFLNEGNVPRKLRGKAAEILEAYKSGEGVSGFVVEPAMNKKTKEGKADFKAFQEKCEREKLSVVKQEHLDAASEYWDFECKLGDRQIIDETDHMVAKNYAAFRTLVGDRIIINQGELETAQGAANSVLNHPKASKLLAQGKAEVTALWDDEDTGYPCKARIDFANNAGYLVDLKTTRDASLYEFSRSISKFGYHRQAAMYLDGYSAASGELQSAFIFICVETEAPYAVGLYMLDAESLYQGQQEYKKMLTEFAACQKSGEWPAYSNDVQTIELPAWHK